MICRMLFASSTQEWRAISGWLAARGEPDPAVEATVLEMIAAVREKGDEALLDFTRQFDCADFAPPIRLSEREIALAAASTPVSARGQIAAAASNIRAFHEAQLEKSWFMTRPDGTILGQRVTPVASAGLYVPGGKGGETPLVSSLLMNAIPAQVAGCERLAVVTPPRADGSVNPYLLAAAHLLDINEVYRVGGPWSIAALAYGTASIPKVDMIAGPGNIFVTTAKKLVHGVVGIDMIAGPSEILILADASANPAWIAADMLSQAEHDRLASAICITDSGKQADAIEAALSRQIISLPRAEIARHSLENWGCVLRVPSLKTGIAIANEIAPEHLELCVSDPWQILPQIMNAGAIFMGQNSPEPVGDYFAGPNHVLPTLGAARFASGLSVSAFCKRSNIISASPAFLRENAEDIAALARLEGLEAHARAVETRSRARSPHSG